LKTNFYRKVKEKIFDPGMPLQNHNLKGELVREGGTGFKGEHSTNTLKPQRGQVGTGEAQTRGV